MVTWRTRHTAVTRTVLRVMLSALLTCVSLARPATASAQTQRLDMVENIMGGLFHHYSYDGGTTWDWVPSIWDRCAGIYGNFVGRVSLVSDRPGRLWAAAKTTTGKVVINKFDAETGKWTGWCGTGASSWDGGLTIASVPWWPFSGGPTWTYYDWNPDSFPAITSWGPGRLDLFMHGTRRDGAIALLHAWRTSDDAEFEWEELGTGLMQNSPAAVSWAQGRIDVFARGGGSDLAHKYFESGRWSAWESLGGVITTSPAVTSAGAQQLNVFVRGTDGALYHRWFGGAWWFDWEYLGGYLDDRAGLTATVNDQYTLDVFVIGLNQFVYRKRFLFGWQDYEYRSQYPLYVTVPDITALYWRIS